MMQNTRDALRQEIRDQVREAVQQARSAAQEARAGVQAQSPGAATQPVTAPQAPVALPPVPEGGGRVIIDRQGDRTVITSASMPPEVLPVMGIVQETALGLMGLLAAMVILGPLVRVFARRVDRRTELKAAGAGTQALQQQLLQLQQSVDAMSLEVERISEAQRFQAKLLSGARSVQADGR